MTALSTSGESRPFDVPPRRLRHRRGRRRARARGARARQGPRRPHLRRAARRGLDAPTPTTSPHRRQAAPARSAAWSSRSRTPGSPPPTSPTSTRTAPRRRSTTSPRPRRSTKLFGRPGRRSPRSRASPATRSARRARSRRSRSASTIERGLIPPTAGLEQQDPEIHLDVVTGDARPFSAGAGAVEQLRFRRPQRLPRARPRVDRAPDRRSDPTAGDDLAVSARLQRAPPVARSIRDDLPWRVGLDARPRRRTRAEVPDAHPPAATAAGAPDRDGRLDASARARRAAGTSSTADAAQIRREPGSPGGCGSPSASLGPTYIKLGQILSSGEGIFPAELVGEFKLLRDRVPPESFDDVRAHRRGRARPAARGDLRRVRPDADRRRLDRPGPPAPGSSPARRSSSRCSAPTSPSSCARTSP